MTEPLSVGVPRALLYYWFAPTWQAFLTALGLKAVVSPPTNKALLGLGLQVALDEVCLPIKLFLGHAEHLSRECDLLLIPHLISLEDRAFTCPKFMGLPDLVRQAVPHARTAVATVNVKGGTAWEDAARSLGRHLGFGGRQITAAWRQAAAAQRAYDAELGSGKAQQLPAPRVNGPAIAVLGHPYCLYDPFLNMDLLKRVAEDGCRVITPEMLPASAIETGLRHLPKNIFWSFGRRQLGAAYYLLAGGDCAGFIHVTAFACGPESLIGELLSRAAAKGRVPLLHLHLDEHTGEAGFLTRLEAYLDMIGRRRC
jgi:predicted nucleotide-binding protein (sugar kinase/HSP70/actin superfamily)